MPLRVRDIGSRVVVAITVLSSCMHRSGQRQIALSRHACIDFKVSAIGVYRTLVIFGCAFDVTGISQVCSGWPRRSVARLLLKAANPVQSFVNIQPDE